MRNTKKNNKNNKINKKYSIKKRTKIYGGNDSRTNNKYGFTEKLWRLLYDITNVENKTIPKKKNKIQYLPTKMNQNDWVKYFSHMNYWDKDEIENVIIEFYKNNKMNPHKNFIKYTDKDYNDLINVLNNAYNSLAINEEGFEASLVFPVYKDYINADMFINNVDKNKANKLFCANLPNNIIGNIDGKLQFGKLFDKNRKTQNVPLSTPQKYVSTKVPPPPSNVHPPPPPPNVHPPPNVQPQNVQPQNVQPSYQQPQKIIYSNTIKRDNKNTQWLQQQISNQYTITNVESQGDCFFATLREAFKTIGRKYSVKDLRQIVFDNYDTWKQTHASHVNMLEEANKDLNEEITDLREINNSETETTYFLKNVIPLIKKWCGENIDNQTNMCAWFKKGYKIIDNKIMSKFNVLINLKNFTDGFKKNNNVPSTATEREKEEINLRPALITNVYNLATNKDIRDMKIAQNIEEIRQNNLLIPQKENILSSAHWAGAMDKNILEEALNINLILISGNNDRGINFTCNIDGDGKVGAFYIMMYYTDNHYELISYKNRSIFKYADIPSEILNQCRTK